MSLNKRHIALTLCLAFWSQLGLAQCFLERPVEIAPERTTDILLEVDGLLLDDLANGQKLCAVFMEWEHGKQENLRVDLISPAGQVVTLVGPGITSGNLSPSVNWNVSFLPCMQPISPDPGLAAVWDNANTWNFLGNYTGSYYPNSGCLQDYDTGSANGPWRLQITNQGNTTGILIYLELQFCDDAGIACDLCSTYAGEWQETYMPICAGDPALENLSLGFALDPAIDADDDYLYTIEKPDGEFLFVDAIMNSDTLAPGDYQICGVAFDASAVAEVFLAQSSAELIALAESGSCIDVTSACMTLSIQASNELMEIEHKLCPGETVELRGTVYSKDTDTLFYSSANPFVPCDTAWHIVITEVEVAAAIADQNGPLVCGQRLFLDGSASSSNVGLVNSYEWTTADGNILTGVGPVAQIDQQGTYYLEVSDGFCTARDTIEVIGIDTFYLRLEQQPAPCAEDPFIINLIDSFDITLGPVSYGISGTCGPNTGTITITSLPSVEVTVPGEYIIKTAAGSCSRSDTIIIAPSPAPLPLSVSVEDTLGCDMQPVFFDIMTPVTPASIFYDGPQLIMPNTPDPAITEPGTYTITIYDNNSCSAEATVEVIAEDLAPNVSLMDISRVCSDDSPVMLTASITGSISDVFWTGPDGTEYNELEPSVMDTGIYVLTVVGENGCISNNSLHYETTNDTIPWGGMQFRNQLPCLEDSLHFILPASVLDVATDIYWLGADGEVVGMGEIHYYTEPGDYSVLIESPNNCTRIIPALVTLQPQWPIFNAIDIQTVETECDSLGEIHLAGDLSQISVAYINGEMIDLSDIIPVPYNNLEFRLRSTLGCLRDTLLNIYNLESPIVDLGPDITLNVGESYTLPTAPLLPMADWTLDWSDESILSCTACLTPAVSPLTTTTLTLVVTNSDGCTTEETVTLTIQEGPLEVDLEPGYYFPTALLLDGISEDASMILGIDSTKFKLYEFYLYDRWGNLIVEKKGAVDDSTILLWDGTFNGTVINSGVYPYMAKLLYVTGEDRIISGQISLLR